MTGYALIFFFYSADAAMAIIGDWEIDLNLLIGSAGVY